MRTMNLRKSMGRAMIAALLLIVSLTNLQAQNPCVGFTHDKNTVYSYNGTSSIFTWIVSKSGGTKINSISVDRPLNAPIVKATNVNYYHSSNGSSWTLKNEDDIVNSSTSSLLVVKHFETDANYQKVVWSLPGHYVKLAGNITLSTGCTIATYVPVGLTSQTPTNRSFCGTSADLTTLQAGTWYDSNGDALANTTVSVGGTYYANNAGVATEYDVVINPLPSAPTASNQSECNSGQTLTASTLTGTNVTWYDAASGGNLVEDLTLSGVGERTLYAQSNSNGCASSSRTSVKLEIKALPAAPTASNQSECNSGQTLTASTLTGTNVTWYDAASGGNLVEDLTLSGVGERTLYAQSNSNGCASSSRTSVKLEIKAVPSAPTVVSVNQNWDGALHTGSATTTGSNTIVWYSASTGSTLGVLPGRTDVGTSSAWAAATNGTCESGRVQVSVVITTPCFTHNKVGADYSRVVSGGFTTFTWVLRKKSSNLKSLVIPNNGSFAAVKGTNVYYYYTKEKEVNKTSADFIKSKSPLSMSNFEEDANIQKIVWKIPGNIEATEGTMTVNGNCVLYTFVPKASGPSTAKSTVMAAEEVSTVAVNVNTNVMVSSYPNPYTDRITFRLTAKQTGKANLSLYNFAGQKVATVFEGMVQANSTQTVEYTVPSAQRGNLIFVYNNGTSTSTGKLMNARK